jgi:hypothetical protein
MNLIVLISGIQTGHKAGYGSEFISVSDVACYVNRPAEQAVLGDAVSIQ